MKICLSCARCGVRYCRQSCQKDDWVAHKAVCRRSNKDEVIGEHTISVSEVLQGLRYASMLLLFNPESRLLTSLRIMTQRVDLRGMSSGNKEENGCSPLQTLIAHWQPLRFSRSTVIFYHCFWRSDKKNGCLPSQTLTGHWQRLRFHGAQSSTIVFGGLLKRTVVRRRNRSLLIGNLCGFTKPTHLPLSLEV